MLHSREVSWVNDVLSLQHFPSDVPGNAASGLPSCRRIVPYPARFAICKHNAFSKTNKRFRPVFRAPGVCRVKTAAFDHSAIPPVFPQLISKRKMIPCLSFRLRFSGKSVQPESGILKTGSPQAFQSAYGMQGRCLEAGCHPARQGKFYGVIRSRPLMYGRSASGMITLPSAC